MTDLTVSLDDRSVAVELSDSLIEFFWVELRNQDSMRRENEFKGRDEVPPATLGSAKDSLEQAPDDVICKWFDLEPGSSLTPCLFEFGVLHSKFGPDVRLQDLLDRHEEGPLIAREFTLTFHLLGRPDADMPDSPHRLAEGIEEGLPDAWFDIDEGGDFFIDMITWAVAP